MVNKDGHFLMILLTEAHNGMNTPLCLCFGNDARLLWVGSSDSTVPVYRYINQQFSLTGVSVRRPFTFRHAKTFIIKVQKREKYEGLSKIS